jgi:putative Mg2+ transporter-C (MgtC) family protein
MDATDMTRIAAQVVTGIGFLCTGIIFKEGANVKGLNTAATIWCAAAIGVLCSSGMLYYATAAAAILIASNLLFRFIADRVHPLPQFEEGETTYILSVTCLDENEFGVRSSIMNRMKNTKLHLTNLESADEIGGKVEIEATVHAIGGKRNEDIENLTTQIALEKGVSKAGWELV